MCRILIYGCPAVDRQITTDGTQTLISCRQIIVDTKDNIKKENFDHEIFITHGQIPDLHELVFVQSVKEEEPEVKSESEEPYEEFVEAIASYSEKEESTKLSLQRSDSESPAPDADHDDDEDDEDDGEEEDEDDDEEETDTKRKRKRRSRKPDPDAPYKCSKCGKILKTRRTYRTHMKMHRERKYICELCSRGFVNFDKLSDTCGSIPARRPLHATSVRNPSIHATIWMFTYAVTQMSAPSNATSARNLPIQVKSQSTPTRPYGH
uniref:C2H2-type domain-containing protein n=1 Tax=Lutzomyia longipalpis TaxID=7200 RepID=A0A1B0CEH1_LUTLO